MLNGKDILIYDDIGIIDRAVRMYYFCARQ